MTVYVIKNSRLRQLLNSCGQWDGLVTKADPTNTQAMLFVQYVYEYWIWHANISDRSKHSIIKIGPSLQKIYRNNDIWCRHASSWAQILFFL